MSTSCTCTNQKEYRDTLCSYCRQLNTYIYNYQQYPESFLNCDYCLEITIGAYGINDRYHFPILKNLTGVDFKPNGEAVNIRDNFDSYINFRCYLPIRKDGKFFRYILGVKLIRDIRKDLFSNVVTFNLPTNEFG